MDMQPRNKKASILLLLQKAINELNSNGEGTDNSLIIFTNFAYIVGKIALTDSEKSSIAPEQTSIDLALNNMLLESFYNASETFMATDLDVSIITIIDATICSFDQSKQIKIPMINLFSDQITGYSFGSFKL